MGTWRPHSATRGRVLPLAGVCGWRTTVTPQDDDSTTISIIMTGDVSYNAVHKSDPCVVDIAKPTIHHHEATTELVLNNPVET